MKRTSLNFIIDAIAFVGFVFLTTTGILMHYVLPPGSGHYSTIWGLDRHQWGAIHFWIAVIFFSILTIHLILHWRWIVSVATGKPREGSGYRIGLGILGLFVLIALSISPLITPVEISTNQASPARYFENYSGDEIKIMGSMTLQDVEKETGVPAIYIIETLKLPNDTSLENRLGTLKKKYDFEINEIRAIIQAYPDRE